MHQDAYHILEPSEHTKCGMVTGTMKTLATTIVVITACLIVAVSTSVLLAMYANVLSVV